MSFSLLGKALLNWKRIFSLMDKRNFVLWLKLKNCQTTNETHGKIWNVNCSSFHERDIKKTSFICLWFECFLGGIFFVCFLQVTGFNVYKNPIKFCKLFVDQHINFKQLKAQMFQTKQAIWANRLLITFALPASCFMWFGSATSSNEEHM